MGVLNVTPDSFSDGGRFLAPDDAVAHGERLLSEGADVLDIGAESTRPGSASVPARVQLERLEPAVTAAVARGATVSVDTTLPEVAEQALRWGARLINDVSCLANPELAAVAARHRAPLIIMHSRGPMSAMAGFSEYPEDGYQDVVAEVIAELLAARARALAAGLAPEDVWLDPGLGFAKSARHSFQLLTGLGELAALGVPLVVGASRKSFIAKAAPAPPSERLGGSIAAGLHAARHGALLLRVHDVAAMRQALLVERTLLAEVG